MADFRKQIARDSSIGAGNFFHRFAEFCTDPSTVLIECDESVIVGGRDYGRRLTVSDVRAIVEQLVAQLLVRGVRARDAVGVFLGDDPRYYLYYIAISRIGAIPALVNSRMPGSIAAAYLRRVGCAAVVLDGERAARVWPHRSSLVDATGVGPRVILDEELRFSKLQPEYQPFRHAAEDIVLIAHTSGTTGAPKPVQFNHAGYFFGVQQQMRHVLGPRVLSALPHSHGAAITMLMSTVIRGVPLYAQTRKDPENVLQTIERWQPNLVMAFPKPLVDLCRVPFEERNLSSVSCWMSTGDASHEPHIRRLIRHGSRVQGDKRRPGSLYIDNLGSSELAFGILRNVHSPETNSYDRCIGRPFEWVEIEIFGEDGNPVPVGQVGRLGVKSPSVTAGYWKDEQTTRLTLLHGYWLTGDLVYRTAAGSYYHVDRTVDRTLVANRTLYSCQLEELLLKHIPEIFDCTVVGVPRDSEQDAVLTVAVDPVDADGDRIALEARISAVLARAGVSDGVRAVLVPPGWNDGLTGKKLKRVVRDALKANPQASVS